jgi:predicted transcriptional regulator
MQMTIPAKSVMTTDVFTVSPETTVAEAARCSKSSSFSTTARITSARLTMLESTD